MLPLSIEASPRLRTGSPATVALARCRPEALRPALSRGLRKWKVYPCLFGRSRCRLECDLQPNVAVRDFPLEHAASCVLEQRRLRACRGALGCPA